MAATAEASSARTSAVRGAASAGKPRSVKLAGRVVLPSGPPSQMYTRPSEGWRRSNNTTSRFPVSG